MWQDLGKRRQFFARIAKKRGFDPLVAKNWYSITSREIIAQKVIYSNPNPLARTVLISDQTLVLHQVTFFQTKMWPLLHHLGKTGAQKKSL
jgi:hypothetical protein